MTSTLDYRPPRRWRKRWCGIGRRKPLAASEVTYATFAYVMRADFVVKCHRCNYVNFRRECGIAMDVSEGRISAKKAYRLRRRGKILCSECRAGLE